MSREDRKCGDRECWCAESTGVSRDPACKPGPAEQPKAFHRAWWLKHQPREVKR